MESELLHQQAQVAATLAAIDALLDSFAHFGIELGLERIERLLNALDNPQRQVAILHVAGSNGKGSVCAYLSAVLTEAGYRVGRYTSPHLINWCERICLNEQPIAPDQLHALLLQVLAAIDPQSSSPTQFEVITAAAWLYFAQQQVDIAVVEVGLGGRLDATNVCARPLVSIITSLSREHWQRLGPTLANIAAEKAGILKPGCPAVLAPLPPEAAPVVQQKLADLTCPAFFPAPAQDLGAGWAAYWGGVGKSEASGQTFPVPLKYPLPLPGAHQLLNSALAIATLDILQQQGWQISTEAIVAGMAKTRWLGRLQWTVWNQQPLLIDGAHNPAGAAALRHYLDSSDRVTHPVSLVLGMIGTKDHGDVLKALLHPGDRLLLVPVPEHIPTDLDVLSRLAGDICPDLALCQAYPDVIAGLEAARAIGASLTPTPTTVLCGSLYLIGQFFQLTNQG